MLALIGAQFNKCFVAGTRVVTDFPDGEFFVVGELIGADRQSWGDTLGTAALMAGTVVVVGIRQRRRGPNGEPFDDDDGLETSTDPPSLDVQITDAGGILRLTKPTRNGRTNP